MKITLARRILKELSTGFSKIISGKNKVPILACVRFLSEKGNVTATATDLDQTAVYALDTDTAEGQGDIIVPLDLLKRLSKGKDRETVTFENDGNNVNVTNHVGGHDVQQTVPALNPDDLPPEGGDIETAPAPGFIPAYRKLAAFASTDESRLVLNSVCADVSGNETALVATDGRRLTLISGVGLPRFKTGAVIPVTRFLQWSGLPEDAEAGSVKADQQVRICVKAGPWTYRVKAVDGIYPNYRQVIPTGNNPAHRISFPDGEVDSLEKVIEAFPGDEYITFRCADNGITLHGKDREGVNGLNVPINGGSSYTGNGCSVTLDRRFLLDALKAGFTEFGFESGHSPLLSRCVDGALHVLMPMRVDETPTEKSSEAEQQSETATTEQAVAEAAAPAPVKTKETAMAENDNPSTDNIEPTAFERLLASFEIAKTKVKEAQSALGDVAADIRSVAREEKARRKEVESVRAGLQKLQSIQV
jgi:DNA polymerase III sliding clamp (beta) subunit (PCNA family)